jgi:hypothetical protein
MPKVVGRDTTRRRRDFGLEGNRGSTVVVAAAIQVATQRQKQK